MISGVGLSLFGCSSEILEDNDCQPDINLTYVGVTISQDSTFYDIIDVDSTRVTRSTKNDLLQNWRYTLAVYRQGESEPYWCKTALNPKFNLQLSEGEYSFIGWADLVDDSYPSGYYYVDDFKELLIRGKYNYPMGENARMACRGRIDASVGFPYADLAIETKPAVSRYQLIATDSADYEVDKIVVRYANLPAAIDGLTGTVNVGWNAYSYTYHPDDPYEVLAEDIILGPAGDYSIPVTVEVYDKNGTRRARVRSLELPLRNGRLTIARSNFFSRYELEDGEGSGGIGIDFDFDDTIFFPI